MSNETKTNRTQLTDLPIAEQEITGQEMKTVKGGVVTPVPPVTPGPETVTKYVDKASPKLYEAISK